MRYLLEKGERPLGVGFFFSLGHSTIVFFLALISVSAAAAVRRNLPALHDLGGLLGAGVSGAFPWAIGILNLLVFIRLVKLWRSDRISPHGHVQVEKLFGQRTGSPSKSLTVLSSPKGTSLVTHLRDTR